MCAISQAALNVEIFNGAAYVPLSTSLYTASGSSPFDISITAAIDANYRIYSDSPTTEDLGTVTLVTSVSVSEEDFFVNIVSATPATPAFRDWSGGIIAQDPGSLESCIVLNAFIGGDLEDLGAAPGVEDTHGLIQLNSLRADGNLITRIAIDDAVNATLEFGGAEGLDDALTNGDEVDLALLNGSYSLVSFKNALGPATDVSGLRFNIAESLIQIFRVRDDAQTVSDPGSFRARLTLGINTTIEEIDIQGVATGRIIMNPGSGVNEAPVIEEFRVGETFAFDIVGNTTNPNTLKPTIELFEVTGDFIGRINPDFVQGAGSTIQQVLFETIDIGGDWLEFDGKRERNFAAMTPPVLGQGWTRARANLDDSDLESLSVGGNVFFGGAVGTAQFIDIGGSMLTDVDRDENDIPDFFDDYTNIGTDANTIPTADFEILSGLREADGMTLFVEDLFQIGDSLDTGYDILLPSAGLEGQIIVNENDNGGEWLGDVVVGATTLAPGYATLSASLGGGASGDVPFDLHNEDSSPEDRTTPDCDNLIDKNDLEEIVLRHYGPLTAKDTGAAFAVDDDTFRFERKYLGSVSAPWTTIEINPAGGSARLTGTIDSTDPTLVDIEVHTSLITNFIYRLIPVVDGDPGTLACDTATQPNVEEYEDYTFIVGYYCEGDVDGDYNRDSSDVLAVAFNQGKTGDLLRTDLNGDGVVDGDDQAIANANLNAGICTCISLGGGFGSFSGGSSVTPAQIEAAVLSLGFASLDAYGLYLQSLDDDDLIIQAAEAVYLVAEMM